MVSEFVDRMRGSKWVWALPSRKAADGEYRDIAHPINSETRDKIQAIILAKYETTLLEEGEEE